MIVVDASAVVEMLLATRRGDAAWDVALRGSGVAAPALLDAEVVQALRTLSRTRVLDVRRAGEAVEDLSRLRVARYPLVDLAPRVWALRDSLSAYDACYVALAEGLGAELLTCDGRLARAHGHRARVTLLA